MLTLTVLSQEVVDAPSVNYFKNILDRMSKVIIGDHKASASTLINHKWQNIRASMRLSDNCRSMIENIGGIYHQYDKLSTIVNTLHHFKMKELPVIFSIFNKRSTSKANSLYPY